MRKAYLLAVSLALGAVMPCSGVAADGTEALQAQLRAATTPEARKAIMEQIRRSRAGSGERGKSASPAVSDAERRRRMEEKFKNDPERLREYRLRESMRDAKTPEARDNIRRQLTELRTRRAAATEAALTPEQKAARASREAEMKAMRAELEPLRTSLGSAKTDAERDSIRASIRQVREKYSRKR